MSPPGTLDLRDLLALAIGVITLLGIGFGRLPRVTLSRAVVAIVGAGATVLVAGLGPAAIWGMIDGPVLLLLFGLMLVNGALAESGFFRWLTAAVVRRAWHPAMLLVSLTFVAGILSALFLNDTVVLMLTPLVIRSARSLGVRPLPYVLALALAANVGSVATITGNPQNVLVAVSAGIGYGAFVAALGPPALIGLCVVAAVVAIAFRRDLRVRDSVPSPAPLPPLDRWRLIVAGTGVAAMLAGFVAGLPVPTVAFVVGAALLACTGRRARSVLRGVDMELLVLFGGLFVVVGALRATGVGQALLAWFLPQGSGVIALGGVSVVLSNLISNVPAVLVLLPTAATTADPHASALALAMTATLAGNLTLVASIANLIVAEGARRQGVEVSFLAHARVGVPVTVVTLAIGLAWLGLR